MKSCFVLTVFFLFVCLAPALGRQPSNTSANTCIDCHSKKDPQYCVRLEAQQAQWR